jgi:hypothetical protein
VNEQFVWATEVRIADYVSASIELAGMTTGRSDTPESKLVSMGSALASLGDMTLDEFRQRLVPGVLGSRAKALLRLDGILRAAPSCPPHILAELEQYRNKFVGAARLASWAVPVELRSARSLRDGMSSTQSYLANYGRLLEVWPTMRAAAVDHAEAVWLTA